MVAGGDVGAGSRDLILVGVVSACGELWLAVGMAGGFRGGL